MKNHRVPMTVTSSVSFDREMFAFMEERRRQLRIDRSQYLRELIERDYELCHRAPPSGIAKATNSDGKRNGITLFPKKPGASQATLEIVNKLREEAS